MTGFLLQLTFLTNDKYFKPMNDKLFTTTDGIAGRLKNPFLEIKEIGQGFSFMPVINPEWKEFERTVISYPIHSDKPIEIGDFSGELVVQYSVFEDYSDSVFLNKIDADPENEFDVVYCRQAIQPIPSTVIEGKGEVAFLYSKDLQRFAHNEALKSVQTGMEYTASEVRQLVKQKMIQGAVFGHTHALTSHNLVSVEEVERVVKECPDIKPHAVIALLIQIKQLTDKV